MKTLVAMFAALFFMTMQAEAQRGFNPNAGCGSAGGKRTCQWQCQGIGAFGRCIGGWRKVCGEWRCNRRTGDLGATEFSSQWGSGRHDRRRSAWEDRQNSFREAMKRKRRADWRRNNLWVYPYRNAGCQPGMLCKPRPIPYPF